MEPVRHEHADRCRQQTPRGIPAELGMIPPDPVQGERSSGWGRPGAEQEAAACGALPAGANSDCGALQRARHDGRASGEAATPDEARRPAFSRREADETTRWARDEKRQDDSCSQRQQAAQQ